MFSAIMFDLDGTLLPIDTDSFVKKYFALLTKKFNHLIEPEKLYIAIMESTKAMVENNDINKTNEMIFLESFFKKVDYRASELMPIFDDFYDNEFKKLKELAKVKNEHLNLLPYVNKKLDIIIATNPIFPKKAILERLMWINGNNIKYKLITSYENMHYCKPNINYYNEILKITGNKPEECLMVGNDVEEDMIAAKLGIKTFLMEDFLVNRKSLPVECDFRGSIKDLLKLIKEVI